MGCLNPALRLGLLKTNCQHAGDDKSGVLFHQAVQACQNALEIYTEPALPRSWPWCR